MERIENGQFDDKWVGGTEQARQPEVVVIQQLQIGCACYSESSISVIAKVQRSKGIVQARCAEGRG
jgi:hypothetical protein